MNKSPKQLAELSLKAITPVTADQSVQLNEMKLSRDVTG